MRSSPRFDILFDSGNKSIKFVIRTRQERLKSVPTDRFTVALELKNASVSIFNLITHECNIIVEITQLNDFELSAKCFDANNHCWINFYKNEP